MKDIESNYSEISHIGPMLKIKGGIIFKQPFRSNPPNGFKKENVLRISESFLKSISTAASKWYESFPNCCDKHLEMAQLGYINKDDFQFIPDQILNNVKYFAYAIETFLDKENGMDVILDYLEYLIQSFGMPDRKSVV